RCRENAWRRAARCRKTPCKLPWYSIRSNSANRLTIVRRSAEKGRGFGQADDEISFFASGAAVHAVDRGASDIRGLAAEANALFARSWHRHGQLVPHESPCLALGEMIE